MRYARMIGWNLFGTLACGAACAAGPTGVDVHVPMASEVGRSVAGAKGKPPGLSIGGPSGEAVVLRVNVADVRHLLLAPADLLDAAITVRIAGEVHPGARLVLRRLVLRRLARDVSAVNATVEDADRDPVAEVPLPDRPGMVQLRGSLPNVLAADLADPSRDHGLLLTAESAGPVPPLALLPVPDAVPAEGSHVASLTVTVRRHEHASLFPQTQRPTTNVYTRVADGHLWYGDQRLRMWGVCRHFWGGPPVLDRLAGMGFNAIRLWGPRNAYTPATARDGVMVSDPGDVRDEDSLARFDRFFADAKQRGFFIWMAGLHYDPMGVMHKGTTDGLAGLVDDGSFLAKPFGTGDDWSAWKGAIVPFAHGHAGQVQHQISEFAYFDPRLREAYRRHLVNMLQHVNPYTGRRYADDEAVAAWELNNEEGLVCTTTEYGTADWPDYFRRELTSQWNEWLTRRYGDDGGVRRAWGDVRPGETLVGEQITFAPMLKSHLDYPAERGADVVHFLWDVTDRFNQQMRDEIRRQAKPGVGAAVVPVVFDTQSLPSAAWLSADARGDAVSFGTYQFTNHSSLSVPPGLFIMDDHTVRGKPTLIYETEAARPCPFRAEYPFRVAALAGHQDWDGVFWHYWKGAGAEPDEGYLAAPMDLPTKGAADGAIYPDEDPAYCAALSIAGRAFLSAAVAPATDSAVHTVVPSDVFGFAHTHGLDLRRDTFTRGALVDFRDDPKPNAPSTTQPSGDGIVHCGSQITYDVPNGRMVIDTPTFKAYVGRTGGAYRFADGITLDRVTQPFAAFAVISADGRPLAGDCRRAYTTAQWDARNSGFRAAVGPRRGGESAGWDGGWSDSMAATIADRGAAPALADPVGYRVSFPTAVGGHVVDYDFALRPTAGHDLLGGQVDHDGPSATFMSVIDLANRGGPAPTPDTNAVAPSAVPGSSDPRERPDPQTAGLHRPISVVGWGEGFDAVDQYLRESTLSHTGISKWSNDPAKRQSIRLTGLTGIFPAPADVEFNFTGDRLVRATATFARSADLDRIAALQSASLGISAITSGPIVTWRQRSPAATLDVTLDRSASRPTLSFQISIVP